MMNEQRERARARQYSHFQPEYNLQYRTLEQIAEEGLNNERSD